MASFVLKCQKINSNSFALTNLVYLSPSDYSRLSQSGVKYIRVQNSFIYCFGQDREVPANCIALSGTQRTQVDASLNQALTCAPYTPTEGDYLNSMKLTIKFVNEKRGSDKPFKVETIEEVIKTNFIDQFFDIGQEFMTDVSGSMLSMSVSAADCIELSHNKSAKRSRGILLKNTSIICGKAGDSSIKLTGGNVQASSTSNMLFGPNFNFEAMGIGGLDKEFSDIFRRAFASRVFPIEVVKNLGIRHVKGILLHGPPGTGKTLIARKIGMMLNAREPKIVNGPEILNKFVGQSEENIRALFADAEKEEKLKGPESELHIIIFDELDAICKERGSGVGGGTGVGDSIVNQLLAKMDGVDQLNNILIIGMTNRKDMLDEALLRPGRLEVHMEIGLPDEHGRIQIFNIHTTPMREHNYMDSKVNVNELAHLSKNYSGAEIEGVVKSAASYALNRQLDVKKITNPDPTKIKVTQEDFIQALSEVKPAFGVTEDKLEKSIRNGIIPFGKDFNDVQNAIRSAIRQVESSDKTPLVSIILSGKPGCGKTALAAFMAKESMFPFIKVLVPEDFVGQGEGTKANKITKAFQDAYKSELSLIVVDDIERFIEFAPIGSRYSNSILQALLVLFKTLPTKGRRLMIIGTTSRLDVLRELSFLESVDHVFDIPSLSSGNEVAKVLAELMNWNRNDIAEIVRKWQGTIEIKRLISLAEMAAQAFDPNSGQSLADTFLKIYQSGMMNRRG